MTILPKVRTVFGEPIGVEIFIQPPNLAESEHTFLSTDYTSGTSWTVENSNKFATGEYVLIGNIGAENAEILRIDSLGSATNITTTAGGDFAHSRGEKITFIPYNQIVIQRSTDSGSTYSTLATIGIRADSTETFYAHTAGASTDYYRAKFYNSASTNESQVSDGVIATGYAEGTAGQIFRDALLSMGERIDDQVITKEFLLTVLKDGRNEIDRHQMIERWSFRTVFDYDAGNVIPGQYKLTLPSDLRDPATFKNVLSARIGKSKRPLIQIDKRAMNQRYLGIAHTTLNGAVLDTDVTITLTSSGDFDESGSIDVAAAAVTGTIDAVAYTSNNESTNVISGVTGIVSGGHTTGKDVWQGASFGEPLEYTVDNGVMIFSQPFSDDLAGENIWLDYYKKISHANSDADTLDEPFAHIYTPYVRYRIKARKNPQFVRETDDDYKAWVENRESQVSKEWIGQDIRIQVDVP